MMFWFAIGWCLIIGAWVSGITDMITGVVVGFALITIAFGIRRGLAR